MIKWKKDLANQLLQEGTARRILDTEDEVKIKKIKEVIAEGIAKTEKLHEELLDEIVNVVIDKYRKEDAEILREVKALEKRITKLEEEDE